MANKITSTADAKPSKQQHQRPCQDCPFARTALRGWLGGCTPEDYVRLAHGETIIDCHTKIGPQCAGAAIYRANVLKRCRSKEILVLPKDTKKVFATPMEFLAHHKREDENGEKTDDLV